MRLPAGMAALAALLAMPAASAPSATPPLSRPVLIRALARAHILSADRTLSRIAHLCDLHIGRAAYPVIDLVESIAGANQRRAYRRAVVMDRALRVRRVLPYDPPAAPLGCQRDMLLFSHDIMVDAVLPVGRRVRFGIGARQADIVVAR